MDLIDRMLGHDDWATRTLLEACGALSDAQLDQEFDIGHRTLRATLDHMIFNVGFWTGLMTGNPVDRRREYTSLVALLDRHERAFAAFAAIARTARDEGRLDDTFVDHCDVKKSIGGTIIHVVLHNEGHRTEAIHMLERLGLPDVPELDHGLWDYLLLNT